VTEHLDPLLSHDRSLPDDDFSYNQSIDDQPQHVPDFFAISGESTTEVYIETKLLYLINNANAPLYLYKEILKWAYEANCLNYSPLSKSMVQKVNVTCYHVSEQLSSLLSAPDLVQDLALLDVNPNNPFGKFESSTQSCFNSGEWHNMAYNQVISDPHSELFVLIILAIDKAKLKAKGSHGCCSVIMTTSLFGQKLRNTSMAWQLSYYW
jgi:hypothetical protein